MLIVIVLNFTYRAFMLNFTYRPFMLNVTMLSVVTLNVVMLSVVVPLISVIHTHPSLIFLGKARSLSLEWSKGW